MRDKPAEKIRSCQTQEGFHEAAARTIDRVGQPVDNVVKFRKGGEKEHGGQQQRERYSQRQYRYLSKDVAVIPFRNNPQHERQVMEQQLHGNKEAFTNQQRQQVG